jgi:hypothetical protein
MIPAMKNVSFVILLVLIIMGFCLNTGHAQEFSFLETEEGVLLKYDHQNIFFYQAATKSRDGMYPRANYIHPLYGLDGEILTEDFPEDHLHHRGIFWAWHQLYVDGKKAGDGWECKGITWNVHEMDYETRADKAIFKTSLTWEGELAQLIHEETVITCKITDRGQVEMDFDIRLTALHEGTNIGGSEDQKGYSGFSIRTKLPGDIQFYSATGEVKPIETAIDAGGWITMKGTFNPGQK